MGIRPTLLPVSPTALVRPSLFQSHLRPLPVFSVYPFSSPLPFLSFTVFPSFNSFSYFCVPGHSLLYYSMSLPYNLPQEFSMHYAQSPVLSSCFCVPHTSLSHLCCALSLCLSGSSPLS